MKFEQLTKLCEEFVDQDYYKNNILKNAYQAQKFAATLLKNDRPIPDELLDTIMRIEHYYGRDDRYSLLYNISDNFLEKQQKPPERVICFLSNEFRDMGGHTVDLGKKYLKNGFEVPECLIKSATVYPHLAINLGAEYVRYNKQIPEPLIRAVSKSPTESVRFARIIMYYHPVSMDVPVAIIKSASKNPQTRRELVDEYKSHGRIPPAILVKKKKK